MQHALDHGEFAIRLGIERQSSVLLDSKSEMPANA